MAPCRECQLRDWKEGRPFPHKRICGKRLSEAEVASMHQEDEDADADADDAPSDAEPRMQIPEPDPGYRRSPALLQQLKLLREISIFDYLVRLSCLVSSASDFRIISVC